MTVVYHIASPAPAPPVMQEPRAQKFLQHQDIFSPYPYGAQPAHPQRAHNPQPFTSVFDRYEMPPRKFYGQNVRNQSNPFGSEADFPKANRNLRLQPSTDPFRSEIDAFSAKPRYSYMHYESCEDLGNVRHYAPARDLAGRAGISSERQYHVPVKGKAYPPSAGDEVFENVRGRKHVYPVFDNFEKTFKVNTQYYKSDLYAANDLPVYRESRSPPATCFNFTAELERKVYPSDVHIRNSDIYAFRHTEPVTKRDCNQPNQVDLRKIAFDYNAAQQEREANYKMMMENKRRWAGW